LSFLIKREDIRILLLAAGNDNLEYRKKVRDELTKDGYSNVIIMEELPSLDDGICFKFEQLLKEHNPDLIITFFHKGVKIDAILFELGLICGKDGIINTRDKLKFLHDGFDFEKTTAYMRDLLPFVISFQYDDSNEFQKSTRIIDTWARNRCKEIKTKQLAAFPPMFLIDKLTNGFPTTDLNT
jgi:hypothetical protein